MKLAIVLALLAAPGCGRLSVEAKTALAGASIAAAGVATSSAAISSSSTTPDRARDAVGITGGALAMSSAVAIALIRMLGEPEAICSDWWARSGWDWTTWTASLGALGAGWASAGRRIDGL